MTTIGSVHLPAPNAPRVVLILLEIFGMGTLFYGLATVAEFFVSGQLSGLLEERRSERMIDSYTDHVIVCGFDRVGRQVSRDLSTAGVEAGDMLVAIGRPDALERLEALFDPMPVAS